MPSRDHTCSCTRGGAAILAPSNASGSFLVRYRSNSQFASCAISLSNKTLNVLVSLFHDPTLASEVPQRLTTCTFCVDGVRIPYKFVMRMESTQFEGKGPFGVKETVIRASVHRPPPRCEILLAAENRICLTYRGDLVYDLKSATGPAIELRVYGSGL